MEGKATFLRDVLARDPGSVNYRYRDQTPLYAAAAYGHEECVDILLDRGAEMNAPCCWVRAAAFELAPAPRSESRSVFHHR